MASITLHPPFPAGTTVGIYPASASVATQGPSGQALASDVVGVDGSVFFSSLPDSTNLVAYAFVGGSHRYVGFRTDPPAATTGTITGINRGQWAPATAYHANDIVTYQGGWYSSNQDFTSGAGFNPANWSQMSGVPSGGSVGDFLTRDVSGNPVWAQPISPDVSGKEDRANKGVAGGYPALDALGKIPANQLPASNLTSAVVQSFSVPGDLAAGVGQNRFYVPAPGTLQTIEASVGSTPGGQPVIVDVNKNGLTVFTTQANRPTVNVGSNTSGRKTPDVTTLVAGDFLSVDIDQVGTSVSGQPSYVAPTGAGQSFAFNTGTYDVIKPTNLVTGDLILVTLKILSTSAPTVTPPTGFTAYGTPRTTSGNTRTFQFWKIDDGTAGPYTFALGVNVSSVTARRVIFHNIHPTAPIDADSSAAVASGTSVPVPALTSVNANALLYLELEVETNTTANPVLPAGYTSLSGWGTATTAAFATEQMGAAGAADTPTIAITPAAPTIVMRTAIRPAAGGGAAITGKDLTVTVRYVET